MIQNIWKSIHFHWYQFQWNTIKTQKILRIEWIKTGVVAPYPIKNKKYLDKSEVVLSKGKIWSASSPWRHNLRITFRSHGVERLSEIKFWSGAKTENFLMPEPTYSFSMLRLKWFEIWWVSLKIIISEKIMTN